MQNQSAQLPSDIATIVRIALEEDIGSGDLTEKLIPENTQATARILCKEAAILCGQPWVSQTFHTVDPALNLVWHKTEGSEILPGDLIATLAGNARSILKAERTALNFLQTLSGTATISRNMANLVRHTEVRLLDTRKTLPGLRTAQKYAVRIGGCHNHRMGLFDAYLVKENHIAACGGIAEAIESARLINSSASVEVEVQNLQQLQTAISSKADVAMLDNFSLADICAAVSLNRGAYSP